MCLWKQARTQDSSSQLLMSIYHIKSKQSDIKYLYKAQMPLKQISLQQHYLFCSCWFRVLDICNMPKLYSSLKTWTKWCRMRQGSETVFFELEKQSILLSLIALIFILMRVIFPLSGSLGGRQIILPQFYSGEGHADSAGMPLKWNRLDFVSFHLASISYVLVQR